MAGGLDEAQRMLAAELIAPLVVPNSSFSADLTTTGPGQAAEARRARPRHDPPGRGHRPQRLAAARPPTSRRSTRSGCARRLPDVASFGGWLLLAVLVVLMLLAWIWRFRPGLWHRDNVLILIGLLVVGATLALKLTAGRPTLPFFLPTAAIAILLAILLDASLATIVIAIVAVIGGAVNGNSLEFAAYIFLGGMAGVVAVRRGDRLQVFVQAALAVFVVNALVVSVFSLLGARDLRGILELWFASAASAAGSGIAAVGTFAVLGSVFGILTVFQLLELANPSQPLLRRLLVETPGTYHHSLMVGNLAERAAEAIGADPLVTRVAAYYHDVGKLANPLAFIENQAGGDNIHDQLDPEVSAQILKQHVADGIDLAYKAKLPKALIAFIPQHHGTAIMSYFYARAKELAGPGVVVDERKFRHAGPKPQSREAALIMLADGVEASVRSLASRDEPAIRAMVSRIIEERSTDGQFDECDLTLRDLERIREAFVGQLLGMYHTRIAYPQNTVVELESRRAAGGGGRGPAPRRDACHLRRSVAGRPDRPRRRPIAGLGGASRTSDRRGAGRRRCGRPGSVAGVDRAHPVRRRRARRAEPRAHGQDRPDRRPVVPAAVRRWRPAVPAFALPPAGDRTSATSSSRSSGRPTRPWRPRRMQTGDVAVVTRAVYRGPWRVDLTVRDDVTAPIAGNALARAVTDALDAGGAPSPASIGLILSDDAELAALERGPPGRDRSRRTSCRSRCCRPTRSRRRYRVRRVDAAGAAVVLRAATRPPNAPRRHRHLGRAGDRPGTTAGRGGQTGDVRWSPADELRLAGDPRHAPRRAAGTTPTRPRSAAMRRPREARVVGVAPEASADAVD